MGATRCLPSQEIASRSGTLTARKPLTASISRPGFTLTWLLTALPPQISNPKRAWTRTYCLRDYNPYWFQGVRNPAFRTATDGRLLDLKANKDHGVENAARDFAEGLRPLGLSDGTILAVVPSHTEGASNGGSPLARVAVLLASQDERYIPMVDCLIRTETVPKKTHGGARDVVVDLRSIVVTDPAAVRNKTVVILDDVSTSGGTLYAARQLVERAGARKVAAVAVGRTVRYY